LVLVGDQVWGGGGGTGMGTKPGGGSTLRGGAEGAASMGRTIAVAGSTLRAGAPGRVSTGRTILSVGSTLRDGAALGGADLRLVHLVDWVYAACMLMFDVKNHPAPPMPLLSTHCSCFTSGTKSDLPATTTPTMWHQVTKLPRSLPPFVKTSNFCLPFFGSERSSTEDSSTNQPLPPFLISA
jgi:hypothetical protein